MEFVRRALLGLALAAVLGGNVQAWVVSGRVTNTGGSGIANVDIDFIDRDTGENIPLVNDDTDFLGFYSVSVPTGDYDIRYNPQKGDRYVGEEIRGVKVESNLVIDVTLDGGWFVNGRVIDERGAAVFPLDLDFVDIVDGEIFVSHDNTDPAGNFQVVLRASTYHIEFEPPASSNLVPKRLDDLAVSLDLDLGDVTLQDGVHLSGLVEDSLGVALPAVQVRTLDPLTGAEIFNIRNTTDVTGLYDLVVAPGSYNLMLIPARGSTSLPRLVAGVAIAADLVLPTIALDRGNLVTGRVRDGGSAPVVAVDLDFTVVQSGVERFTPRDNTDDNGDYVIAVSSADYDILYTPPPPTGLAPAELTDVAIGTDTALPDVVLGTGHVVSGTVVDTLGSPLAGVDLDFVVPAGGAEQPSTGDTTAPDGTFAAVVGAGTYDVRFNPVPLSGSAQETITGVAVAGNVDLGTVTLPAAFAATPGGIVPANGSARGGTPVTVSGASFAPGVKVLLGGIPLRDTVRIDATTVQGTTPAHPVGSVDVTAVNPGAAGSTLVGAFGYTPPAADPLLTLERTGPLNTDVLLQWSDTGQASYSVFRSADPASFDEATILDVQAARSYRDDGAAAYGTPGLSFYVVH